MINDTKNNNFTKELILQKNWFNQGPPGQEVRDGYHLKEEVLYCLILFGVSVEDQGVERGRDDEAKDHEASQNTVDVGVVGVACFEVEGHACEKPWLLNIRKELVVIYYYSYSLIWLYFSNS